MARLETDSAMYYFCTYFDLRYLARGLALYDSLRRHCKSFQLWILCMDQQAYENLHRAELQNVILIKIDEFEKEDGPLCAAKANRTLVEYYFTCTPSLPLFILERNPHIDVITYLDADLYFFSDPQPIYDELGAASIAVTEHRFAEQIGYKRKYGIYNVGYLSFRRDADGLACLRWWRERCLEWCYDRLEGDRFADQKYLDRWPSLWPNLVTVRHKGANLAPWNIANYKITTARNLVLVDGQPLIFFHFHGLVRLGDWLFEPNLMSYQVTPSRIVLKRIYKPYIRVITRIERQLQLRGRAFGVAVRTFGSVEQNQEPNPPLGGLIGHIRWLLNTCRKVYEGRYLLVLGRRSSGGRL